MTEIKPEPQKPMDQDYHYQVDQQVSVNVYFDVTLDGEAVRFQITSRYGSTVAKITSTTRNAIEAYQALRQEFPRIMAKVATPAPKVEYKPVDESGAELPEIKTFTADRLGVDMHEGTIYTKVLGKQFPKFGVQIWPEVLEAAGFKTIDPTAPPIITGWRADYVMKEKGGRLVPDKVTRLLPPIQAGR